MLLPMKLFINLENDMKKIVLTSINPVKLSALKKVVASLYQHDLFDFITLSLEKDGPEPIGRIKLLEQIQESLLSARAQISDADYYVCIEGGMEIYNEEMHETAHVVVESISGGRGVSSCPSFQVPTWIAEEVKKGRDFANTVDEFYKTEGTKLGGGFVKILTNGLINKEEHCMQALTIAFATVDKDQWYK